MITIAFRDIASQSVALRLAVDGQPSCQLIYS